MAQLASDATTGSREQANTTGNSRAGLSAWAALLVVWLVWGSTYLAIRVADRSIPPFAMAAARYLTAGALLYPLAWLGSRRRRAAAPPAAGAPSRLAQWGGMAVVGTLLLAFGNGGVSYAEQTLPSGLAALLVASVPLWMALADRVLNGQRIGWRGWIALLLGLAGIAVLARPSGNGALLPVLVVLAASVSWGTGSVLAGRLPAPASPLVGSAMEMLAGGVVLTGLAAATGELARLGAGQVSGQSLLGLLYLIGPGSLLGLTCYVIALRRLPTAVVSTYAYVNPVVAVSLGALLLGERPTLVTLAGGAVVVLSVAILLSSRARSRPPAAPAGQDGPDAETSTFPLSWSCRILVRWERQLIRSRGGASPSRVVAGGRAARDLQGHPTRPCTGWPAGTRWHCAWAARSCSPRWPCWPRRARPRAGGWARRWPGCACGRPSSPGGCGGSG